jgi:lambda repressor-like predicted transcriptional regulator
LSIVVHSEQLRYEMTCRGWAAVDLARESHLSQATVSTALHGKPIAAQSFALIARALSRAPVLDIAERLMAHDDVALG